MTIKKITTSEEFEALKIPWQRLFDSAGLRSPFLSWEWMFVWWQTYQIKLKNAELNIFCAYKSEALQAVLPLFTHQRKGLIYVQFLGTEFESSDYLDLICTEEKKAELFVTFLRDPLLKGVLDRADILIFNNIKEDSVLFDTYNSLSKQLRNKAYSRISSVCPYISLPQSVEEVLKSLSKNMRSSLKRQRNKLAKNETVQITLLKEPSEIEEGIVHLFRLHSLRFSQKKMSTKFVYDLRGAFHKTMAKIFLSKGWLQFYLIKENDTPVGALYCYRLGGAMMYMQGGFDPAYAKLALGNQIILRAIGDAIDGEMDVFDFMRGNEPYKKKWTNKNILLYTQDFPLSRKGAVFLQLRENINFIKKTIKKIIASIKR